MVAMCGEVLNFVAYEASVGSSEIDVNALNNIGVTRLLKPQSQQGLPSFPLARYKLAANVVVQTDYAACIETDSVGTSTNDLSLQKDIETRRQQKAFFSDTIAKSIAPFYPFLVIDSDTYLSKPSCVV